MPDPNKFLTENAGDLQGMVDIDWEEKKVVFQPFLDFDLISISYEDDFLRHMAALKAYVPIDYANFTEKLSLDNFDILDIKNNSDSN